MFIAGVFKNKMNIIQLIHGYWRWLLALVVILLVVKYVSGLITGAKYAAIDERLGRAFAGTMTVQFVLGLLVLISKIMVGGFNPRIHMEHAFTGMMAVALAHAMPTFKRGSSTLRFISGLILAVLSIAIAVYNVIFIRGNWFYN